MRASAFKAAGLPPSLAADWGRFLREDLGEDPDFAEAEDYLSALAAKGQSAR
jgi:hypothetical protein